MPISKPDLRSLSSRWRRKTEAMNTRRATYAILMLILSATCVPAQDYRIDWGVIPSGGASASSTSFKLSATIGQPSVGFADSASVLHWIGFWSGSIPTPTVVAGVCDAKKVADGTFIGTSGKIATSAIDDFDDFLYIEDPNRVSGIRVDVSPSALSGLARGSVVSVMGTMGTTADGERQITGPIVIVTPTTTPLIPLGINGNAIGGGNIGTAPLGQVGINGGAGLNNIGLLVRVWGTVTETGQDYLYIDDGSNWSQGNRTGGAEHVGVRVVCDSSGYNPGDALCVTGISSCFTAPGGQIWPRILARAGDTRRY